MFQEIKKYLFIIILVIILLGGGWYFFFHSKKPTSNQAKNTEEEKDWGNISGWFSDDPELKKGWKNHDFTYDQTHDWINVGLSPIDFPFAAWLRDKKNLSPEEVLNHGNEKSLREEWINDDDYLDNGEKGSKEWFSENRQLTAEEINWALKKMPKHNKIKILLAEQFNLTDVAYKLIEDKDNNMLFSQLLNDIQDESAELVFIPVNNDDNHWSLLIYEKSSTFFYHYDINGGVNFEYTASLLRDLLTQMKPSVKSSMNEQWWEIFVKNRLSQKKENDYNGGIAVINIIKRIIQLYNTRFRITAETIKRDDGNYSVSKHNLETVEKSLGEFDFSEERKFWQEKYFTENK